MLLVPSLPCIELGEHKSDADGQHGSRGDALMRAKTVVSLGGQDVDLTDDNVSYALWKLGDLRILVRLRMCGYLPAQQVLYIVRASFFLKVIWW
jgi:hypothetical protein